MPYKDFSSFTNIRPAFGDAKLGFNYGFTASPVSPSEAHEDFENDVFLIFRRSEYAAQIELACAKIFKMLMGYGPEMEIVQNGDKFFIASRRIRNFREGYPDFNDEELFQDMLGFAETHLIYYFLCGIDNRSGNYGVQNTGQQVKAYRIDMPEAFDFEMLSAPLKLNSLQRIPYHVEKNFDDDLPMVLPKSYVTSVSYQDAKQAIIKRIAATPFTQFEKIIRETVTTDLYSHSQAMLRLALASQQIDEVHITAMTAGIAAIKAEDFSLEALIHLFRIRHEQWQLLVRDNPDITQDFTLLDDESFWAERKQLEYDSEISDLDLSAASNVAAQGSNSATDSDFDDEDKDSDCQSTPYNPSRFFPEHEASTLSDLSDSEDEKKTQEKTLTVTASLGVQ